MNTRMNEVMNKQPRTCLGTMKAIDAMQVTSCTMKQCFEHLYILLRFIFVRKSAAHSLAVLALDVRLDSCFVLKFLWGV